MSTDRRYALLKHTHPTLPLKGRVTSSTASTYDLPATWSVTRVSTGLYRVSHDLSNQDYAVIPAPVGVEGYTANVLTKSSTYFEVVISNASGTRTNATFDFTVIK